MKKIFFLLSLLISFSIGQVWGADYAKTAAGSVKTGDVVIITYDNGTLHAMSNDKGTSNPPSAVAVTATNDIISSDATNILWDVTVADGSYTFKPHGDAKNALYCTSTNNGVRVGTNANNAFTVDETSKYLVNTATSRYVGVYNSQDFRCYTSINANIKNQNPAFYVLQEGGDEPGGDEPGGDEPGGDDPTPTSNDWIKVEPGDLATNDVVVIVENDSKAMSNDKGTSAAPAAVAVTVSEDKLSEAPADNIKWTVTVSDGSYVFATGDNHLYCTNTNNGVRVGTNANSAFTISDEGYLYNTATSRYVGVYSNSDWRCYTTINSNISGQTFSFFKESDGSAVKPAAGLAYATADQKKLAKVGEAFTAPTLTNPYNVDVTYASSAESVATVAANGAVTIKAAGVAVITASFAGNGNYKAGSASYTIGVTSHAGTSADPYVAADVKTVIDVMGTVENAYASGVVSNVVTTTLPAEGYITFYFSADGLTTGQQIEAFKCLGLNSAQFEAVTDVETGATVVITGNLKKYQSTYEFDQNCHLVSYTAPAVQKQSIANTKETAYTVAQAITYAADGVTYDLDDYVYVQGVVYDVKSFNNGAMDIYIKDANAENQFELFKCAGINDGNSTTPFEALADVQVGDEVIGYGQMTVYNSMSELKQGNYLVELTRPTTPEENVVILAVYDEKYYAMSTTNENNAFTAIAVEYDGTQVTVNSAEDKAAIQWTKTTNGDNTTFQDASGKYMKSADGTTMSLQDAVCNWVWDATGEYYKITNTSRTFFYQNGVGFKNFATSNFDKSGYSGKAQVIAIAAENIVITSKADPQLAYSPTSVTLTVGGAFTPATLTYASGFDGLAAVTYKSSNTNLATVEGGVVSLVADATGKATITATFAGNTNYFSSSASYTITVNEVSDDLSGIWVVATSVAAGDRIIIANEAVEGELLTMGAQNGSYREQVASTVDGEGNLTPADGTKVFTLVDASSIDESYEGFALKAINGKYLSSASNSSNNIKEVAEVSDKNAVWSIEISEGVAAIVAQGSYTRKVIRYNSGNTRFSCYAESNTMADVVIYKQASAPVGPQPEEPVLDFVELRSGLRINGYYTICVPQNILAVRGATFWSLNNRASDGSLVYFEEAVAPFEAGKPYIYYTSASTVEVAYGDETVDSPVANGALRGTFSEMNQTAINTASAANNNSPIYIISNDMMWQVANRSENSLGAYRAYIVYKDLVSGEPNPAPGRRVIAMPMQGNTATGIDGLNADTADTKKVILNGQFFIIREGKTYDVTGCVVK